MARTKEQQVATLDEFFGAVDDVITEDFYIKSLDKVVKIAPASMVETHRIINELQTIRDNPDDAEARAAWEVAWVVACVVEPEITTKAARKLINSRNPDVRRLSARCQTISSFGIEDDAAASEESEDIDVAEEVPGTAPLE